MMQLTFALTLQGVAGIILLAGVLIVIAVAALLIATSCKSGGELKMVHNAYKKRSIYFIGFSLCLIIILFVTIQFSLYRRFQEKADEVVTVVGIQWDWQMAHGVTTKTPHRFLGKNEISLPVRKKIKFIVMSDDVTHSFGIYNSKGVLLTQVQAIPQYKNELLYAFTQKGKYSIFCLEYCGLVHPFMSGTIYVQ